jgi:hypothetical protein
MEREWVHVQFASYWCGLKDLARRHLLRHELVHRAWGVWWRPHAATPPPPAFAHWAFEHRFLASGGVACSDARVAERHSDMQWAWAAGAGGGGGGGGVRLGAYPLLVSGRTPRGGWRLANCVVIMLADAVAAGGCDAHYGPGAQASFSEPPPPPFAPGCFARC